MSALLNPSRTGRLFVELAATAEDVLESQRLRYRIFAGELGANLPGSDAGIDEDPLDRHCRHLLVRNAGTGDIVASTRLLDDATASTRWRPLPDTNHSPTTCGAYS